MNLSEDELQRAISYYCDYLGFRLTPEQFIEILNENPELSQDILESDIDTCNREAFMSAFGRKLLGKDWPTGMTPRDEAEQFFIQLRIKAQEMGYDF